MTSPGAIRTGGQEHFYLETQSVLVVPAGEEMELKVYVSSQWPTLVQVSGRSTSGRPHPLEHVCDLCSPDPRPRSPRR